MAPKGPRYTTPRDWADDIVREHPNKFAYVPPSQYRTTD
jgi:hypothetical protein